MKKRAWKQLKEKGEKCGVEPRNEMLVGFTTWQSLKKRWMGEKKTKKQNKERWKNEKYWKKLKIKNISERNRRSRYKMNEEQWMVKGIEKKRRKKESKREENEKEKQSNKENKYSVKD